MRSLPWLVVTSLLLGSPALAASIHLQWNDCAAGPTSKTIETFLCQDDTSTFHLVGTVTLDSQLTAVTSVECYVDFMSSGGGPLSDWWQLQSGGCREGSLVAQPRKVPEGACTNLWPSSVVGIYRFEYPHCCFALYAGRLEMVYAVPASSALAPTIGTEYYVFDVTIDAAHTIQAGNAACGGCSQSLCIAFFLANLNEPLGLPQLDVPSETAIVSWRCPATASVFTNAWNGRAGMTACTLGDCTSPAERRSWGQIKTLYR
jgi:hypothetical protein